MQIFINIYIWGVRAYRRICAFMCYVVHLMIWWLLENASESVLQTLSRAIKRVTGGQIDGMNLIFVRPEVTPGVHILLMYLQLFAGYISVEQLVRYIHPKDGYIYLAFDDDDCLRFYKIDLANNVYEMKIVQSHGRCATVTTEHSIEFDTLLLRPDSY